MAKKMALTRSENKPISNDKAVVMANAVIKPTATAVNPGPSRVLAMAMP